ncbi:HrpF/NolX family T3SS translocon protein [Robbsia sp. Bb-Pol-6]|uniref:HrpF/NolX family T3SS translocon protein n=1 Tax=Robbsia betulipollinis TaxID=2981849 RepID=A0ABT3ZKM7_9BURK|nr:HrpF/NolX family T3SS translocon protein [Robbsia betulipollinis]MCY0387076.1 HrpF/NolX family T3SS translocon protein [Robbsia betulipollinis]
MDLRISVAASGEATPNEPDDATPVDTAAEAITLGLAGMFGSAGSIRALRMQSACGATRESCDSGAAASPDALPVTSGSANTLRIETVVPATTDTGASASTDTGASASTDATADEPSAADRARLAASGGNPTLTDDEMATLAVLDRHAAALKGKVSDLQSKIDDPKTPSDLKAALQKLKDDPALRDMLDAGKKGKVDGRIGVDDVIRLVAKHPEMVAYQRKQAAAFVANYIPSDAADGDTQPRAMTSNDAMRELYRYSDYLPKHISKASLQARVDGTGSEGKTPPQLVAAAKHMLDHPDAFQSVAGDGTSISRGHLEDAISKKITLTESETDTLQTIGANRDAFFGGGNLTRDKLRTMSTDPNASDAVKTAAQQLLNDPLLFGMLDNGKKGHSGNPLYAADDGKIGGGDFDSFTRNLESFGQYVATPPPTSAATSLGVPATSAMSAAATRSPADGAAIQAMQAGTQNQPKQKKSKGGGFMKFLKGLLHVFSKILDVVSTVLDALARIPGIGVLFAGASMAAKTVSGQLEVASVAAGGGG